MNRLKKELIKLHVYPSSKEYSIYSEGNNVQLEGSRVRIYSERFIRVTVFYNVLDIDVIIDSARFSRDDIIDVFEEDEFEFDGKLLRSETLKYYPKQFDIHEYNDGLRLYTHWLTGDVLFAEKRLHI